MTKILTFFFLRMTQKYTAQVIKESQWTGGHLADGSGGGLSFCFQGQKIIQHA